ncbi:uncharacterized protein LOC123689495 [Pieris rapae]|uniref:uncharacterized protein LOC123689495 n=1 Tax=Pieris rapae TaxID=64459 RepID=UPI001E27E1E7|nr:uncharacterized protein LOC123689495 [Pieris rapae]
MFVKANMYLNLIKSHITRLLQDKAVRFFLIRSRVCRARVDSRPSHPRGCELKCFFSFHCACSVICVCVSEIKPQCVKLQRSLDALPAWLAERRLTANAAKTQAIVFGWQQLPRPRARPTTRGRGPVIPKATYLSHHRHTGPRPHNAPSNRCSHGLHKGGCRQITACAAVIAANNNVCSAEDSTHCSLLIM